MEKKTRMGICTLTKTNGNFVDCHIIPEALTVTSKAGPLRQSRPEGGYTKRQTSWYDKHLVTQSGEDILQGYDDWAIKFFRAHRLIWSSWGPMTKLLLPDAEVVGTAEFSIRRIADYDYKKLRLFFLSLLWRAAATTLREFQLVKIEASDLEVLRLKVLHADADPWDFYPVSLFQLSTTATPHNESGGHILLRLPCLDKENIDFANGKDFPVFRFFFDGLIAHIGSSHVPADHLPVESFLAPNQALYVTMRAAEGSSQLVHLRSQAALIAMGRPQRRTGQ